MDIRYFAFLERLKRGHGDENTCLRSEMDNRTRPLTGELGVRIPPEAQIPPHLRSRIDDSPEKAAKRLAIAKACVEAENAGLYELSEHLSESGVWLEREKAMTVCSHGKNSDECLECRVQTIPMPSVCITPNGKIVTGDSEESCSKGCDLWVTDEYPGAFGTGLHEIWEETHVEGNILWLDRWRGYEMKTDEQAVAACGHARALLGDACGRSLRARALTLLGGHVCAEDFDLVVTAAHSQGISATQFVVREALRAAGAETESCIGDERDFCAVIDAAHDAGMTGGSFIARAALEAAKKLTSE